MILLLWNTAGIVSSDFRSKNFSNQQKKIFGRQIQTGLSIRNEYRVGMRRRMELD
jgi:hypothetical protein